MELMYLEAGGGVEAKNLLDVVEGNQVLVL